uniref:Uncharacterized protein n=1 Tax=Cannabis sativa TaxID=3483 RepID=A0A803NI56_CANSA
MARIKRSRRLLDVYDPHVVQFIKSKLTVPKSKNLDKTLNGKVMEIELLKAAIESDNLRNRAFRLRPLVFSTLTEHQAQLIQDDYYLPITIV